jgi:cell division protein FtsN
VQFADAEIKKLRSEGYRSAKILFSQAKQFNYVMVSSHSTKEKALKQVEKIKADGTNDVWILSIEK